MRGMEQLLTAKDVARRFAVSPSQVYQLARLGVLPCVRVGGAVRFDQAAVEKFIAANSRQPMSGEVPR